jgi:hypothetical protein
MPTIRRPVIASLGLVALIALASTSLNTSDAAPIAIAADAPDGKSATNENQSRDDASIGALVAGATFVPINPYRAWDSRINNDVLTGGSTEVIEVYTDTGNVQRIPSNALAVSYNLTVTNTVGWGFIALYPADISTPNVSSINWTSTNQTIANGGIVAIGDWNGYYGAVEAYLGPNDSRVRTDYIIDITGYFIL